MLEEARGMREPIPDAALEHLFGVDEGFPWPSSSSIPAQLQALSSLVWRMRPEIFESSWLLTSLNETAM
jgi:hypothetical protein